MGEKQHEQITSCVFCGRDISAKSLRTEDIQDALSQAAHIAGLQEALGMAEELVAEGRALGHSDVAGSAIIGVLKARISGGK